MIVWSLKEEVEPRQNAEPIQRHCGGDFCCFQGQDQNTHSLARIRIFIHADRPAASLLRDRFGKKTARRSRLRSSFWLRLQQQLPPTVAHTSRPTRWSSGRARTRLKNRQLPQTHQALLSRKRHRSKRRQMAHRRPPLKSRLQSCQMGRLPQTLASSRRF